MDVRVRRRITNKNLMYTTLKLSFFPFCWHFESFAVYNSKVISKLIYYMGRLIACSSKH